MPRNKRRCKTGATVKFSQPTDEGNEKSSYESKLREWRKVRDSLETEARSQAEILCMSIEDEIAELQRSCLASLQNLDPMLLNAPYELLVECEGDSQALLKKLTQNMESDMRSLRSRQPFVHHKPPAPSKSKRKRKKLNGTEPDDMVTSTSDHLDMPFVTPSVNKLTAGERMTVTGVTGRKLKHGEKPVMKYLYVSDITGSPIVDPDPYHMDNITESCDRIMQCLPKKYRQKLEATLRETGAKIVQMKEQDLAAVTPFH